MHKAWKLNVRPKQSQYIMHQTKWNDDATSMNLMPSVLDRVKGRRLGSKQEKEGIHPILQPA